MSGSFPTPTFPWGVLVDGTMADLTDTELRVLLVVLRQTVGRGKARDWLSRSQMVARTGRSPDAVSRAVDRLVRQGLLLVEDESGRPHDTPEARRAARTALYFRPGRNLMENPTKPRVTSDATTEVRNKHHVVAYGKTPPERTPAQPPGLKGSSVPDWLGETAPPTAEEQALIEREKERIRQKLRRGAGG